MWSARDYQQKDGWYRPVAAGGGSFSITALAPVFSASGSAIPSGSINASGYNALVLMFFWGPAATPSAITAASVNSVSATRLSAATSDNSANGTCSDIWYIPSGPNGALSVTISTAINNGFFVCPYGIMTATTIPANGYSNKTAFASSITASGITTPSGGGLIGICSNNDTVIVSFDTLATDNAVTYQGQFGTLQGVGGHTTTGGVTSVTGTATASSGPYSISVAAIAP